jgi:hypothetical protein
MQRYKRKTNRRRGKATSYNQRFTTYQDYNHEASLTILKSPFQAMPDIFQTTVVYFENNFKFDLGTSDKLLNQDIAINDPYDPYISLGGKSANMFSQIMAIYRFARVLQSDVRIKYTDVSGANSCPTQLALVLNSEGVNYADFDDIQSLPIQRRRITTTYNDRIGSTYTLSGTFHPKDCFYMTNLQWDAQPPGSAYDVTNIGGIVSPVNLAILSIYYGRIDENNTDSLAIRGTLQVSYLVRFSSRQSFTE